MAQRLLALLLLATCGVAVGVGMALWLGYSALGVLVPALGIGAGALVARNTLRPRLRPLIPAVAVLAGHALWLLQAVLVLGRWSGLIHILPLMAGLVWLVRRPEPRAGFFLAVVSGVEILLLLVELSRSPEPGAALPWIAAHIILRVTAVLLMLRGLRTIWRRDRRPAPRL